MSKSLSATMIGCIELMREHGREFVRYQGGFWASRDVARQSHNGVPVWYVGTQTINALVARGYGAFTEHRDGKNGRFPIAVTLTDMVDDAHG